MLSSSGVLAIGSDLSISMTGTMCIGTDLTLTSSSIYVDTIIQLFARTSIEPLTIYSFL